MIINNYLWDENKVRYQLTSTQPGGTFNWLFLPGGPGTDSSYLTGLVNLLDLPGNCWLIDLPGNGDNHTPADFNFDQWYNYFTTIIKKFKNPIIVGHSFGAMFPLLFPELENLLKGFVILNSAPSKWLEEAATVAQKKNLPLLTEPMEAFVKNPCNETFNDLVIAGSPYYFHKDYIKQGEALLASAPKNYLAALWWINKVNGSDFTATWIPQQVPTLILGGTEDSITPLSLFQNDVRFKRNNIRQLELQNAGHAPWIEKPLEVKHAFAEFLTRVSV